MKFLKWIPFALLFISIPHTYAYRELLDQVIAVVNDEPITQSELDVLLKPVYEQYRQEHRGEELIIKLNEARRKLLNQLIEDRLVYQEAQKREIEVDYSEVDAKMDEFKKQFPSEMAMEEMLNSQGMTLQSVRDRLKKQLMMQELHDQEIRGKIVVSPKEIQAYYEDNSSQYAEEERIKVRSITLKKSYETRDKGLKDEAAYDKIKKIREEIAGGADFAKLAKEHSEDIQAESGGLSDWIRRGTMIPVINDVIFTMKLGEVSEILETPMGYHLFRVEERETASRRSLEEVRDEIFNTIYRKKIEDRFFEWMQELKRDAYISIR